MNICIIGAGPSGLCAAKEVLQAHQHAQVVIFESSDKIGGVFAHSYDELRLVNNNLLIAFSDFNEGLSYDDLHMWSAKEYVSYLNQYAIYNNILPLIQFSTSVISVISESEGWNITTEQQNKRQTRYFDFVVVCSGLNQTPHPPSIPGMNLFTGEMLHSNNLKKFETLNNKRVVIVGGGESASDLSFLIGKVAKEITLSINRSPGYLIPRYHDGIPNDLDTSRLYHSIGRKSYQLRLRFLLKLKRHLEYRSIKSQSDKLLQRVTNDLNSKYYNADVFQRISTKSEGLQRSVLENNMVIKPKITFLVNNTVTFENGDKIECDFILFASGFKISFDFLDNATRGQIGKIRDLYNYMLPVNVNNIAFIGFMRPGVGSIPPMAEMQARYLGQIISGQKKKPSYDEMIKRIIEQNIQDTRQFPLDSGRLTGLTDYVSFMNSMADQIGCNPCRAHLLLSSPLVYFKVIASFLCPAQFRLYGPFSQKRRSKKILIKLPTVPLWALLIESIVSVFNWQKKDT